MELADFQKMEQIRARVDAIVADPADRRGAEALLPAVLQAPVLPRRVPRHLQPARTSRWSTRKGKGVERITEKGVVVDGVEYELDCLIYATGFEVGTDYTRRAGYELYGRDGVSLTEKWASGVAHAARHAQPRLPELLHHGQQQTGFTVNFPHMLNEQSKHIAYIVRHAVDDGVRTVEVSEAAESGVGRDDHPPRACSRQDFLENCTPGYYNNEGKPGERSGQNGFYGGGSVEFFRILQEWRAAGGLKGLELLRAGG